MSDNEIEKLVVELAEFNRSRFFGKYRGIVKDVDDPEKLGRVVVNVPEVYGEENSPWALPSVPFAGADHGLVVLPEVGDGVWIEFEAGDPSRPIWVGGWWGKGEMPAPGGTKTRVLVTSGGHKAILDDDKKELKLLHSGGSEVTMTDDDIKISDGNGNNLITIKIQQGQINVQGVVKVVVEAPQIELVENAMHPVVFGDMLLQYLNQLVTLYQTHVHPGELAIGILPVTPAPPVPPFPPATQVLLSMKVKTG